MDRAAMKKLSEYADASGWTLSFQTGKPLDGNGKPIPWYTYSAIEFLAERIKPTMNVLEFGSGNSTLWWSARVQDVTSVEHDLEWGEYVRKLLPCNVIYSVIELEINGNYANHAEKSGRGPFDIIVVDGRDRVNCALNSVDFLRSDGIIVFDNAERNRYRFAHANLQRRGFKRLKFVGLGALGVRAWDTSIFYRTDNCLGI